MVLLMTYVRRSAKESVTVRIPEKLKNELGMIADTNHMTLTEVFTKALEQWVRCYHASEEEHESGIASSRG